MDGSVIQGLSFFSPLPPEELEDLMRRARIVHYRPGELIFAEGDAADHFSIILEGSLEVFKVLEDGSERQQAVLGPNDFLGEMSLFFHTSQRSAGARTLAELSVLQIGNADFGELLKRQPELLYTILRTTVQRMRSAENVTIQDLQIKNSQLQQALSDLQAAQVKLLEKERLETELALSRRIQLGLLPRELPVLEGWRLAALWQPAYEVSGDFYDFIQLPSGALGLVIADVTGKGIPAALVMATTRSVLRSVIFSHPVDGFPSPGEMLVKTNDILVPDMPPMMFVTCLLAFLDPPTGRLLYANAGHNPPYLRSAQGVTPLRARGMPLGLMPGMTYEEFAAVLNTGDSLLAYTDGIVEAHDPGRAMFDDARLAQCLAYPPDDPPLHGEALIAYLMGELAGFTGPGWVQEDDVTLVTLQRC